MWGPLAVSRVVARPVVRVWPPERYGAIDTSTDLNPFRRALLKFRTALDEKVALWRPPPSDGAPDERAWEPGWDRGAPPPSAGW